MRRPHVDETPGLGFHHRAEVVAAAGALLLQVGGRLRSGWGVDLPQRRERVHLLNSAMVAVGMREGGRAAQPAPVPGSSVAASADPYAGQHARVISRLLRFIETISGELQAANAELQATAETDRLTGVPNRLKLDATLQAEVSRAHRYGTPLSLVLMDIDLFKHVNDSHGHLAGDSVLVRFAELVRRHVRVCDPFGRWGGEEFLAILPGTGLSQAAKMAEKVRALVEGEDFPMGGRVTCSMGVAQLQPGEAGDGILGRVDAALYAAKRAGRNGVSAP